jgi:hypothetical protein
MTVQVQPARPKEQFDGLQALEASLLSDHTQTVTAVITYEVAKIVDDLKKDEQYPVLYIKSIEPLLGDHAVMGRELLEKAYKARTGEDQLDFNFEPEAGEGE